MAAESSCLLDGAVVLRAAAGTAGAALREHLVDELVDALIGLRLVRVGLIGRESAVADLLVDALMRGVLERGRHVVGGLAVRLGDLGQGLARQLGAQLIGGDADRGSRGIEALADDAGAAEAEGTTRATAARAALRQHLVDELVDALSGILLARVGLVGRQPAGGDLLVDALVGRVLERGRHIVGGLAVRLGDLRQGLAGQFRAQLIGGDADRRGGVVAGCACAAAMPTAAPPRTRTATPATATRRKELGRGCMMEAGTSPGGYEGSEISVPRHRCGGGVLTACKWCLKHR